MEKAEKKIDVVTKKVSYEINRIKNMEENERRATLANLRRGIGKEPGTIPEIWDNTLGGLPDNCLGYRGKPSKVEKAIHNSLTLFALHQQGKEKDEFVHEEQMPLGLAVSKLVENEDDLKRIKPRFDAAATSSSIEELYFHIRGLINLMKAKNITLDYVSLSRDFYNFQYIGSRKSVQLKWGEDFYRGIYANRRGKEEEKNDK